MKTWYLDKEPYMLLFTDALIFVYMGKLAELLWFDHLCSHSYHRVKEVC